MDKFKTALAAIGKATDTYADALRYLEESAFTAVCSRSLAETQEFAHKYQVLPFDNITKIIETSGVEAVLI